MSDAASMMKILRVLLVVGAACFAAVLTLLLVVYFSPGLQKRLVLGALPAAPGRSVQIEHVRVSLNSVELQGFFLLQGQEGISLEGLSLQFSPLSLLGGEIRIRGARIENLLVDVSQTGSLSAVPSGQEAPPAPKSGLPAPFEPILGRLEQMGLSLHVDDVQGNFEVLLPEERRLSGRFSVAGVAPGATGTIRLDLEHGSAIPASPPDLEMSSRLQIAQVEGGRLERIALSTDVSVRTAALDSGMLMLSSNLLIEQAAAGEQVTFNLGTPRIDQPLLSIEATVDYVAQNLQGKVVSEFSAEDLAKAGWSGRVPSFSLSWNASFSGALDGSDASVESASSGRVWDLGHFLSSDTDPGALVFDQSLAFRLINRNLLLDRYRFSVVDSADRSVLSASVPNPITLSLDDLSAPLQQLQGTVLEVSVDNLPVSWISSLLEGVDFDLQSVSARALVMAENGTVSLTPDSFLQVEGLNLSLDGRTVLAELDFRAVPEYRLEERSHAMGLRSIRFASGGKQILGGTFSCTMTMAAPDASMQADMQGDLELSYPELFAQPLFAGAPEVPAGRASMRFSARHEGDAGSASFKSTVSGLSIITRNGPRRFAGEKSFDISWSGGNRADFTLLGRLDGPGGSTDLTGEGMVEMGDPGITFKLTGSSKVFVLDDYLELISAFSPMLEGAGEETSPAAQPEAEAPGAPASDGPPWKGISGTVDLKIAELRREDLRVRDAGLKASVDAGAIDVSITGITDAEPIRLDARVAYESGVAEPYRLSGMAKLPQWNLGPWAEAFSASDSPLLEGIFDIDAGFSSQAASLDRIAEAIQGRLNIASTQGTLRPLGEYEGVASIVQLGLSIWQSSRSSRSEEIDIAQNLINQLREVDFQRLLIQAERLPDGTIRVGSVDIAGTDLRFTGEGTIIATPGQPLASAPMRLSFKLNGRNKFGESLRELKLAGSQTDDLGFYVGPPFQISGSPGDPKSTLSSLILSAGAQYLQSRRSQPAEESPAPSP